MHTLVCRWEEERGFLDQPKLVLVARSVGGGEGGLEDEIKY